MKFLILSLFLTSCVTVMRVDALEERIDALESSYDTLDEDMVNNLYDDRQTKQRIQSLESAFVESDTDVARCELAAKIICGEITNIGYTQQLTVGRQPDYYWYMFNCYIDHFSYTRDDLVSIIQNRENYDKCGESK